MLQPMSALDTDRLDVVFRLVQDETHWKNPIDAVILADAATPDEIREAVIFYTGSVPTIEPCSAPVSIRHQDGLVAFAASAPAYRVRAAGYFATIGA